MVRHLSRPNTFLNQRTTLFSIHQVRNHLKTTNMCLATTSIGAVSKSSRRIARRVSIFFPPFLLSLTSFHLARKPTPCPVTGLPARYLHPGTGIPFANLRAYRTIEGLTTHQYVWSEGLDCYIADQERTEGATGVPEGWDGVVSGKKEDESSSASGAGDGARD